MCNVDFVNPGIEQSVAKEIDFSSGVYVDDQGQWVENPHVSTFSASRFQWIVLASASGRDAKFFTKKSAAAYYSLFCIDDLINDYSYRIRGESAVFELDPVARASKNLEVCKRYVIQNLICEQGIQD